MYSSRDEGSPLLLLFWGRHLSRRAHKPSEIVGGMRCVCSLLGMGSVVYQTQRFLTLGSSRTQHPSKLLT